MLALVALSLLAAPPTFHVELSTHSGFGLLENSLSGMQDFGMRFEVHLDDELRFIGEAWARPFNITTWAWVDAGDGQFSTRVVGGHVSGGLEGELHPTRYWMMSGEWDERPKLLFSAGPSFGVFFGDDQLRLEARVAWLAFAAQPDYGHVNATAELTWRVLQLRVVGGASQLGVLRTIPFFYPFFSVMLGLRFGERRSGAAVPELISPRRCSERLRVARRSLCLRAWPTGTAESATSSWRRMSTPTCRTSPRATSCCTSAPPKSRCPTRSGWSS